AGTRAVAAELDEVGVLAVAEPRGAFGVDGNRSGAACELLGIGGEGIAGGGYLRGSFSRFGKGDGVRASVSGLSRRGRGMWRHCAAHLWRYGMERFCETGG